MIYMKQMLKKTISKMSAGILTAAMALMVIPSIAGTDKVRAADSSKDQNNTILGTDGMAGPSAPEASKAWEGSYVYFGSYDGTPIKFRVLAPQTTAFGGTTLFLDSDRVLFAQRFDVNDAALWEDSEIRNYLNNEFYTGSFSAFEQSAIFSSKVKGGDAYSSDSFKGVMYRETVGLSDDKVFLLDSSDLNNESYGYSSDTGWTLNSGKWTSNPDALLQNTSQHSVINHQKIKNDSSHWWLRSEAYLASGVAGTVDGNGALKMFFKAGQCGVAPAVNVDLSHVLFSTAVDGEPGKAGTGYKLTIINESLTVDPGPVSVNGSTISCNPVGNGDMISVLVTDGEWNSSEASIIYLGAFNGTIDLSAIDVKGKDYKVYLIAEELNGDKETDYASVPVELSTPSVTVTFNANGHGTAPVAQKVSYGNKITKPSDLTASGFTFGGWYTDSACTKTYDFNSGVTGNITLYAKWTVVSTPTTPVTPVPEVSEKNFEDFVERLYVVALGRASEADGKAHWCKVVGNGSYSGADCARFFLTSPEFNGRNLNDEEYLKVLYKTFFDRDASADPDGFNFWLGKIGEWGRARVLEGFIDSTEWCNICADYGVRSGAMTAKATKASKNATAFATRLYTECLGREPEEGGLNYWSLSLTNQERTGTQAAKEFFYSPEFKDKNLDNEEYVNRLYKTFMGRDPEAEGKAYWLEQLGNGSMNRDQVFDFFSTCEEFTGICNSYAISR